MLPDDINDIAKPLNPTNPTPKGEWITGSDGKPVFITTESIDSPLGFKSEKSWQDYRSSLQQKIKSAQSILGINKEIKVGIQGSSATGVSSKTGNFITKPGDLDIVMINDQLFDLVISRATAFANNGELIKGESIEYQLSYVANFRERGEALLNDARLLPELNKQSFSGAQIEPGIKISQMVARQDSLVAKKYTIYISP